jgi:hypothetical protein
MSVIETIRSDFEAICHAVESKRAAYSTHVLADDGILANNVLPVTELRNIVMEYLLYT